MRALYVGNFVPPHSTENEIRRAFTALGWTVEAMQESDFQQQVGRGRGGRVLRRMAACDLVLHTLTQGSYPRPDIVRYLWRELEKRGVPTASLHLDRFYGLSSPKQAGPQRDRLPAEHPMFRVAHVFTADGGHDAEFARDGVNHHWLPPGVSHTEAVDLDASPPSGYLVGFAGSDRYHREWPHRPQLVEWLRENYRDRFLHIGGTSTPRITGLELNRVLQSVPVWVGDSCLTHPADRYWSDRVPETWGRGGFLIHPYVEALNEHYEGREHPGSPWECGDWSALRIEIDYWLGQAERREHVRLEFAGFTRAQDTYIDRVDSMLTTIGLPVCVPDPA